MNGGGGRGLKSKNVVEINIYLHKQNCNISIIWGPDYNLSSICTEMV